MRPGAPERTGIGYEQLKEINPDLVYLYAGGYGSTGPYSHRPSMAPIAGAVSGGGVAQMGRDAFPPPDQPMTIDEIAAVSKRLKRANDGTADHNTAMVNAVGLLLGLYARERTGAAQYVESTMIAANAYANINDFYWHEGKPARPLPGSRRLRAARAVPAVPSENGLAVPGVSVRGRVGGAVPNNRADGSAG